MKRDKSEVKRLLAQRTEWAKSRRKCWVCGAKSHAGFPLETHEIERRSHAPNHHWAHTCNYFRACKKCHMDDLAAMPHAEQLAYKKLYDPLYYDRETWLSLRDPDMRAPKRVTGDEVRTYYFDLKQKGHPK